MLKSWHICFCPALIEVSKSHKKVFCFGLVFYVSFSLLFISFHFQGKNKDLLMFTGNSCSMMQRRVRIRGVTRSHISPPGRLAVIFHQIYASNNPVYIKLENSCSCINISLFVCLFVFFKGLHNESTISKSGHNKRVSLTRLAFVWVDMLAGSLISWLHSQYQTAISKHWCKNDSMY